MGEMMNFPGDWKDFIREYSFTDKKEIYTNGSELISVFRVEQMLDHYLEGLTPQQIKDMQFCLKEKSRECGKLRQELQELKNKVTVAKAPVQYGDEEEPILRCPSCDEDVTDLVECGFNFCPYCGSKWID